jgi:uncharacterized RDD family membrane protein YckC
MRYLSRFNLQTPESVELEFVLAGIGSRAFALGIDYTLLIVGLALLLFVLSFLAGFLIELFSRLNVNARTVELWMWAIVVLIVFTIYVGYFVGFETLWQGQTPGKRWAKIRVVRDNGRPVRLSHATLRALLRPIDDWLSIGAWLIIFSPREKRLGDWVAGTLVIQEESRMGRQSLLVSENAQPLATQLLQQADIPQLQPADFAVIREYLQRRQGFTVQARNEVSLRLARQIKLLIALEQVPANVTADLFLEAVYLAYQQQSEQ